MFVFGVTELEQLQRGHIHSFLGRRKAISITLLNKLRDQTDGIFDIWGRVYDVSISHNLITDTLLAQHLSRSTPPVRERISFYGNVYARNNERQPKFKYDNHLIDFVNNVVYGWGWMEGGASGLRFSRSSNYETKINVENNIYHFTTEASHGRENQAIVLEGRGREVCVTRFLKIVATWYLTLVAISY